MTAARADTLSKEGRKFIGCHFLGTAPYREFETVPKLVIYHAGRNFSHLNEDIRYKTQDIGITLIGLDHTVIIVIIIYILNQGNSRQLHLA